MCKCLEEGGREKDGRDGESDREEEEIVYSAPFSPPLVLPKPNRLVVSNLEVAAAKLDEAMPEASLGCFTIGDEVSQVALLMCNGKDAETASPVEKGEYLLI